jgi:hypothetical protein
VEFLNIFTRLIKIIEFSSSTDVILAGGVSVGWSSLSLVEKYNVNTGIFNFFFVTYFDTQNNKLNIFHTDKIT